MFVLLGLDDGVVDVHRRAEELAGLRHLVEAVHAGYALLHDSLEGKRWNLVHCINDYLSI